MQIATHLSLNTKSGIKQIPMDMVVVLWFSIFRFMVQSRRAGRKQTRQTVYCPFDVSLQCLCLPLGF